MRRPTIFIADDDAEMRSLLAEQLCAEGYAVETMRDGFVLLERLREVRLRPLERPDAIVTDVRMPGHSGLEVFAALRRAGWETLVVLMTGFSDAWLCEQAARLGGASILEKPFDFEALHALLLRLPASP